MGQAAKQVSEVRQETPGTLQGWLGLEDAQMLAGLEDAQKGWWMPKRLEGLVRAQKLRSLEGWKCLEAYQDSIMSPESSRTDLAKRLSRPKA